MSSKLFVGNLSFQISDMELNDVFKEHGEVASAKVVVDRRTGRSRGYGFVEMTTEDNAKKALEALNGKEVSGRPINVSYAHAQGEGNQGPRNNGSERSFSRPSGREDYSEF